MTTSAIFLCCLLKGSQRACPHLVEVCSQPCHAFRIELVEAARSCLGVGHKAHVLQYLQVLRNSRTRNRQHACKLAYGNRPGGELLKYRHACCIGERIKSGL
jgi:hypothetical protein